MCQVVIIEGDGWFRIPGWVCRETGAPAMRMGNWDWDAHHDAWGCSGCQCFTFRYVDHFEPTPETVSDLLMAPEPIQLELVSLPDRPPLAPSIGVRPCRFNAENHGRTPEIPTGCQKI
jgi:hypothetical protein